MKALTTLLAVLAVLIAFTLGACSHRDPAPAQSYQSSSTATTTGYYK